MPCMTLFSVFHVVKLILFSVLNNQRMANSRVQGNPDKTNTTTATCFARPQFIGIALYTKTLRAPVFGHYRESLFIAPGFSQLFLAGEEWVGCAQWQGTERMIDNSVMRLISSDG